MAIALPRIEAPAALLGDGLIPVATWPGEDLTRLLGTERRPLTTPPWQRQQRDNDDHVERCKDSNDKQTRPRVPGSTAVSGASSMMGMVTMPPLSPAMICCENASCA
eukprot:684629-Alexandrium_andersonii.AAC.1